jgi:hypothetical protein
VGGLLFVRARLRGAGARRAVPQGVQALPRERETVDSTHHTVARGSLSRAPMVRTREACPRPASQLLSLSQTRAARPAVDQAAAGGSRAGAGRALLAADSARAFVTRATRLPCGSRSQYAGCSWPDSRRCKPKRLRASVGSVHPADKPRSELFSFRYRNTVYCARRQRYAQMEGAARLLSEIAAGAQTKIAAGPKGKQKPAPSRDLHSIIRCAYRDRRHCRSIR